MYNNGAYLTNNPGWHESDATWKASQVLSLLDAQKLRPKSIVDVGCGTGVCWTQLPTACMVSQLVGYDPSAKAVNMVKRSERVDLRVGTPADVDQRYDLLLSLDVFEHVEDYIGFLRFLRPIADRFIFHIPLDLSAQTVIRERPLLAARSGVGHLHYFTRATALASLETAGFEIICDKLLLPSDMPDRRPRTRIRQCSAAPDAAAGGEAVSKSLRGIHSARPGLGA